MTGDKRVIATLALHMLGEFNIAHLRKTLLAVNDQTVDALVDSLEDELATLQDRLRGILSGEVLNTPRPVQGNCPFRNYTTDCDLGPDHGCVGSVCARMKRK